MILVLSIALLSVTHFRHELHTSTLIATDLSRFALPRSLVEKYEPSFCVATANFFFFFLVGRGSLFKA